jgi:YjbE family integral membrane protein
MGNWASWIESLGTLGLVLQIIGINIVLSGDNAVVIALACRGLPDNRKRMGMVLGAGVAVGLRLIFIFIVAQLLAIPFLKVIGALLLFWIAVKLITEEGGEAHSKIGETDQLWYAIRTIAIADVVMSFDNVIAVVAAAKGSWWLIVFGIGISVPLIIFGATLVMWLLERFPLFIWIGAALLGWIAGEMLVDERVLLQALAGNPQLVASVPVSIENPAGLKPSGALHYTAAVLGAILVVVIGYLLRRRMHHVAEEVSTAEIRH